MDGAAGAGGPAPEAAGTACAGTACAGTEGGACQFGMRVRHHGLAVGGWCDAEICSVYRWQVA